MQEDRNLFKRIKKGQKNSKKKKKHFIGAQTFVQMTPDLTTLLPNVMFTK